ncbi:MAG TPA: hypothetical protein VM409_03610 [Chloroflexia bacterium]|nr:hypothetical protein [Chloroflexia bacterium]
MMRLDLDTEIRFPEGDRAGILRRVILDEGNEVTAVVMATEDLVSRDVIVPVHLLADGPGGVLTINSTPTEIDGLEGYSEERLPMIVDGWEFNEDAAPGGDVFPATMYQPMVPVVEVENLPQGSVGLGQGTEVWCLDGRWGVVDEVVLDDSGQATGFIARSDEAGEFDRLVPLSLAQEITPELVTLNCTLIDLPTYTQESISEHNEPEIS